MVIKVLGPGCANCQKLKAVVEQGVAQLGLDARIEKVEDMPEIMAYGVMSTPALVIDEELRLAGRVPSLDDVVRILRIASQRQ